MNSENHFGNNLRNLRIQHGLTQAELAKKLHVNVKSIKNWENGLSSPSVESLSAVMHLFHLSADALLGTVTNYDYVMIPNDIPVNDRKALREMINAIVQVYCNHLSGKE